MIEVKLRLWLTHAGWICAIGGMARVAADGVDLVLDHLQADAAELVQGGLFLGS